MIVVIASILFEHHPKLIEELDEFIHKHCPERTDQQQVFEYIEKLLTKHYCERTPSFTPKHLGQAQGFDGYPVFWLKMAIPNSGLSQTQFPKVYFYKNSQVISFLCLDSHLQNYKNSKLKQVAKSRLTEMLEVLTAKKLL